MVFIATTNENEAGLYKNYIQGSFHVMHHYSIRFTVTTLTKLKYEYFDVIAICFELPF